MVLFNINAELASFDHTIVNPVPKLPESRLFEQRVAVRDRQVHSSRADVEVPREVPSHDDEHLKTASVLGLT
jgi:hypothetical protein